MYARYNNTVFAKSDFWSKTRQPAPVSPISETTKENVSELVSCVNDLLSCGAK